MNRLQRSLIARFCWISLFEPDIIISRSAKSDQMYIQMLTYRQKNAIPTIIPGQQHSVSITVAISKPIGKSVLNGILEQKRSSFVEEIPISFNYSRAAFRLYYFSTAFLFSTYILSVDIVKYQDFGDGYPRKT